MFKAFENIITRQSSDGKENEGIRDVKLSQKRFVFDGLPKNAEELGRIDRSGDDGKLSVLALLICAFKTWTPDDQDTCCEMLKCLMNSPLTRNNPPFNNFAKSFIKDRMMQNGKYDFLANAYFEGATPQNGYTPNRPYAITVREYVYAPQRSTIYGREISVEKTVIEFAGADSERQLSVYKDPVDGQWYIFSDSYKALLVDIKQPW